MAIEWREDLAIGVEEIDSQHKELFARFNNLLTACNQGKGRDEVINLIHFLQDYVRVHFTAEERLQARHFYPEYPMHRQEHERFMGDIARLEEEFRTEGATVSLVVQTNKTLIAWLIHHISVLDRAFGDFLQSRQ